MNGNYVYAALASDSDLFLVVLSEPEEGALAEARVAALRDEAVLQLAAVKDRLWTAAVRA